MAVLASSMIKGWTCFGIAHSGINFDSSFPHNCTHCKRSFSNLPNGLLSRGVIGIIGVLVRLGLRLSPWVRPSNHLRWYGWCSCWWGFRNFVCLDHFFDTCLFNRLWNEITTLMTEECTCHWKCEQPSFESCSLLLHLLRPRHCRPWTKDMLNLS